MRIAVHLIGGQPDARQKVGHPRTLLGGRAQAVDHQRLGNQIADAQARVQRGHRILEHHLHPAAQRLAPGGIQMRHFLPGNLDPALMRHKANHGAGDGGFAAAAFADQGKGLAPADVEADMFHRMHMMRHPPQHPALQVKAHLHIVQPGDDLGRGHLRGSLAPPHTRHRRQQVARIGGAGAGKDLGHGPFFHRAPLAHDDHPVGHLGDHAHVMGDQDDRRAQIALQIAQQVQHLALHGHVQRRGGFVGNQHFGPQGQGHGDHHPLAHAARQLMRILVQPSFGLRQADLTQRLQRAGPRLAARDSLMGADRLDQLHPHGQHRVQRGHRLLKDHRNPVAAHAAHGGFGQAGQIGVAQPHRAASDPHGRRWQEAHDRQRGDGFARAAFAGNGQRFAAPQGKGQVLHQRLQPGFGVHRDAQAIDRQNGRGIRGQCGPGQGFGQRHSKTQRGK